MKLYPGKLTKILAVVPATTYGMFLGGRFLVGFG
jgi:hypothetical protein